jgi:hypothetical protein
MEFFIIFSAIALVVAFLWNTISKTTRVESAFMLIATSFLLFISIDPCVQQDYPSAKSVYEGKTTLQITYEDSIPVDTVVVYKPEYRKK